MGSSTIKSEIMLFRAMEADANSAAAMACAEMRTAGDKRPWRRFEKQAESVALLVKMEPNFKKGFKVSDAAMKSAFYGWYGDTIIKGAYEKGYILSNMKKIQKEKSYKDNPYSQVLTSEEIINKICRSPSGKTYFTKKDALEADLFSDISVNTYSKIGKFFAQREAETGMKPDESYKSLKIRSIMIGNEGGICFEPKYVNIRPENQAVKNKMAQGR